MWTWKDVMWQAAWDECVLCSSRTQAFVAEYEAWFEVRGKLLEHRRDGQRVRPDDPPHCVRQAYCQACAYEVREEQARWVGEEDMPMLVIRTLK